MPAGTGGVTDLTSRLHTGKWCPHTSNTTMAVQTITVLSASASCELDDACSVRYCLIPSFSRHAVSLLLVKTSEIISTSFIFSKRCSSSLEGIHHEGCPFLCLLPHLVFSSATPNWIFKWCPWLNAGSLYYLAWCFPSVFSLDTAEW